MWARGRECVGVGADSNSTLRIGPASFTGCSSQASEHVTGVGRHPQFGDKSVILMFVLLFWKKVRKCT